MEKKITATNKLTVKDLVFLLSIADKKRNTYELQAKNSFHDLIKKLKTLNRDKRKRILNLPFLETHFSANWLYTWQHLTFSHPKILQSMQSHSKKECLFNILLFLDDLDIHTFTYKLRKLVKIGGNINNQDKAGETLFFRIIFRWIWDVRAPSINHLSSILSALLYYDFDIQLKNAEQLNIVEYLQKLKELYTADPLLQNSPAGIKIINRTIYAHFFINKIYQKKEHIIKANHVTHEFLYRLRN